MRKNWILTPLETTLFFVGVTLLAGGIVWTSGVG
jgi:hypothetical protein